MLALISPAKTMISSTQRAFDLRRCSEPRLMEFTRHIVELMLGYNSTELADIFKISAPLSRELRQHFAAFFDQQQPKLPAALCYNGVVYKHFNDHIEWEYLQKTVRISSLLYGTLRPMDLIQPYRMEEFVRLSDSDERVDKFWRDKQTDLLIQDVKESGGVLLYLASQSEQKGYGWQKVLKEVRVIEVKFLQYKGGKLRQVVIYTKMARGEMIRFMMERQMSDVQELKSFEWGGYSYRDDLSTPNCWTWVME